MALIQVTIRLKANYFERESALPPIQPSNPYPSHYGEDVPKYSSRDKPHSRGYSAYSGGYGGADVHPPEPYGSYGASQVRFLSLLISPIFLLTVCRIYVYQSIEISYSVSVLLLIQEANCLFFLFIWLFYFLQGGGSSYGSYGGYSGRSGSAG